MYVLPLLHVLYVLFPTPTADEVLSTWLHAVLLLETSLVLLKYFPLLQ